MNSNQPPPPRVEDSGRFANGEPWLYLIQHVSKLCVVMALNYDRALAGLFACIFVGQYAISIWWQASNKRRSKACDLCRVPMVYAPR